MRVLMAEPFFPPPIGGPATVAAAIVDALCEAHHSVEVLCAAPTYRSRYSGPKPPKREQWREGVRVRRIAAWTPQVWTLSRGSLWGRAYTATVFAVQLMLHLLIRVRRSDVVITSTYPPVLATAAVRWVCRLSRTPYVYHCQDLNPEAAVLGGLMSDGFVLGRLTRMEKRNRERAGRIVVLSGDMARTLLEQGFPAEKVTVINNFIGDDEFLVDPLPQPPDGTSGAEFRILFAGNMGPLQQLGTVLEAARELEVSAPRVRWVLAGDGPEAKKLEVQATEMGLTTLEFLPFLSKDEIRGLMQDCDLGLVAIAGGVERVAYPSKTLDYLGTGCRVLAVVEPSSELAALVLDHDLGAVAAPGDLSSIVTAVLSEQSQETVADRSRIVRIARQHFGETSARAHWMELLSQVVEKA